MTLLRRKAGTSDWALRWAVCFKDTWPVTRCCHPGNLKLNSTILNYGFTYRQKRITGPPKWLDLSKNVTGIQDNCIMLVLQKTWVYRGLIEVRTLIIESCNTNEDRGIFTKVTDHKEYLWSKFKNSKYYMLKTQVKYLTNIF